MNGLLYNVVKNARVQASMTNRKLQPRLAVAGGRRGSRKVRARAKRESLPIQWKAAPRFTHGLTGLLDHHREGQGPCFTSSPEAQLIQ